MFTMYLDCASGIGGARLKLHLQVFWQNIENGKMQKHFSIYKIFTDLLQDFHRSSSPNQLERVLKRTNSPWVCLIKV